MSRRRFLTAGGGVLAAIAFAPHLHRINNQANAQTDDTQTIGGNFTFHYSDSFIDSSVLANFTADTQIDVAADLFTNDAALFASLQAGADYDLLMVRQDSLVRMIEMDLLMPINHQAIPNMLNLASQWVNLPQDAGNRYSVPYSWGTFGIGYRMDKIKGSIQDMRWLLDSDRYSGRIGWVDSPALMLSAAMEYLGLGFNSSDFKAIIEAEKLLISQKKHVGAIFPNQTLKSVAENIDIFMAESSDIYALNRADNAIGYALASNGSQRQFISFVIPKGAAQAENAVRFIDYILDEEIGYAAAQNSFYATVNQAVLEIADSDYRENLIRFPPELIVNNLPFASYLGEAHIAYLSESWARILAS